MKNFKLIGLFILVSGCTSYQFRTSPELVEKRFSPTRGGIITHQLPEDRNEQRHYAKAAASMMRKFCDGTFKVLSEKTLSHVTGMSSLSSPMGNNTISSSSVEREKQIAISFECTPSVADDVQIIK